jgi:hypothetical protein
MVKGGLYNYSPTRGSRTLLYIYLWQYCEETKLNKYKTTNDLTSEKPLTQHITQITAKLKNVPSKQNNNISQNFHFHSKVLDININCSILNQCFYCFM